MRVYYKKVMLPGRKLPESSLLRTHTHENLERLKHLAGELQQKPEMASNDSRQAGSLPSSEVDGPC